MEIQISHLDNLNKILLNIRLNMASQISQFPALLCFLSEQTHRAKGRWHGKAPPRAQLARNPDRTAERNDAQLVESGESGEGEESAERCMEFHQSGRGFHRAVHWGRERMPPDSLSLMVEHQTHGMGQNWGKNPKSWKYVKMWFTGVYTPCHQAKLLHFVVRLQFCEFWNTYNVPPQL